MSDNIIDINNQLTSRHIKSYGYMYKKACRAIQDHALIKERVIRLLEEMNPMIDLSQSTIKYKYPTDRKNDFPSLEVRSVDGYDVYEEWLLDAPPIDYSLQEYLDFLSETYLTRSTD